MTQTQSRRATAIERTSPSPLKVPELGEESTKETHVTPRIDRAKKVQFTEIFREHSNRLFCWECGVLSRHSTLAFHLWDEHNMRLLDYRQKHGSVVVSK